MFVFIKKYKVPILVAVLVLFVVFGAYIFNFHNVSISNDSAVWGTFGDFIGGVLNPIFGFITIMILLYTMSLQTDELKNSVKALNAQHNEFKESKRIAISQNMRLDEKRQLDNLLVFIKLAHSEVVRELELKRECLLNNKSCYENETDTLLVRFSIAYDSIVYGKKIVLSSLFDGHLPSSLILAIENIAQNIENIFYFINQVSDDESKENLVYFYSRSLESVAQVLYLLNNLKVNESLKDYTFYKY